MDLSLFRAPSQITSAKLNTRSPEFRVAHVRYYGKLKEEKFPMLDKKMYFDANEDALGVKLRRFQDFFKNYQDDLEAIKKRKSQNEAKAEEK